MRLGDVDKLLYHKRKVMFFGLGPDDECWGFAVPVGEIDKAPTIDAVPVVRCRECKYSSLPSGFTQRYGEPGTLSCHFGPCNRRNVNENDFCSYGQRKEDGHDKYPSDPV